MNNAVIQKLHKVKCPILIIHSTNDQVSSQENIDLLDKSIQSKQKKILVVHKAHHSVFDTNPDLSGDLNGDGVLNVLDVVVMVNVVLASDCPDGADMNADGACNVLDVVILVNLILG